MNSEENISIEKKNIFSRLGINRNDLEGKAGAQILASGTAANTKYLNWGQSWRVFDDA